MDNPYWESVADAVRPGDFSWEGPVVHQWAPMTGFDPPDRPWRSRDEHVRKYAWTITDPDSVEFVATHTVGSLVDPMAGTGYWAYLLRQLGIEVVCYDLHPPDSNHYHKEAEQWVEVTQLDGAEAATRHPDATLLLSWPPYSEDAGARTLSAYQGRRVIFIGEGEGGCTGDDKMHEDLASNWIGVDERTPIQWWGLHDRITVYDRKEQQ